jgi:hypothetical protein
VIDAEQSSCVRNLFYEVFKQPMSEATWRWKYRGLLEDQDHRSLAIGGFTAQGELVAHAGALVFPGLGSHADEQLTQSKQAVLVQVCDVMIATGWRGAKQGGSVYQQLMTYLRECLQRKYAQPFAFGFPGLRPFRLGERLGFYRGIQALKLSAWTNVFDEPRVFRIDPLPWASALDWLDEFWQNNTGTLSRPLIARNGDYLQWRYAHHPEISYQLWIVSKRIGLFRKRVGWLITRQWHDGFLAVDGLFRGKVLPANEQLHDEGAKSIASLLMGGDVSVGAISAMAALRNALSPGRKLWRWHVAELAKIDRMTTPVIAMQFLIEQPIEKRPLRFDGSSNSPEGVFQFTPGDSDVF